MTEPNNHTLAENQNEQSLNFLRNEIADLKSRLTKKEDRIATLNTMLNQVMEGHHAEVRAYEDLEDKLEDMIEKLRNRVPHSDILDFLKGTTRKSRSSSTGRISIPPLFTPWPRRSLGKTFRRTL
jgi:predicted nuclease with TOPRIM domain